MDRRQTDKWADAWNDGSTHRRRWRPRVRCMASVTSLWRPLLKSTSSLKLDKVASRRHDVNSCSITCHTLSEWKSIGVLSKEPLLSCCHMKSKVTSFMYVLKQNCMRSVPCNGLCVCVYESSSVSGSSMAKINFVMDPFLMQFLYFYSTFAYHDRHQYYYIQLIKYCDEISFSVLKAFLKITW